MGGKKKGGKKGGRKGKRENERILASDCYYLHTRKKKTAKDAGEERKREKEKKTEEKKRARRGERSADPNPISAGEGGKKGEEGPMRLPSFSQSDEHGGREEEKERRGWPSRGVSFQKNIGK